MEFSVSYSPRFERDFDRLARKNPPLIALLDELKPVLQVDPYNRSRMYRIKKLEDIKHGEGQWCLRIRRFRVRYDIIDFVVRLHSIKPRKDAYKE